MRIFRSAKKYIKYRIVAFFMLPFFFSSFSFAAKDLLWQLFSDAEYQGTTIHIGENVKTVGDEVLKGGGDIGISGDGVDIGKSPSIIIKVARILLMLTIALSITMILYNGMIYIIETGQGKEGKSLAKNVFLIVVGILVSLFSLVIINLIQSIPGTLDEEPVHSGNTTDNDVLLGKRITIIPFH